MRISKITTLSVIGILYLILNILLFFSESFLRPLPFLDIRDTGPLYFLFAIIFGIFFLYFVYLKTEEVVERGQRIKIWFRISILLFFLGLVHVIIAPGGSTNPESKGFLALFLGAYFLLFLIFSFVITMLSGAKNRTG